MDKTKSLILAAIVVGGYYVADGSEKPIAKATESQYVTSPSKVAKLPDGGKIYVLQVITDAGYELRTTPPDCVRRPIGNKTCFMVQQDGGIRDPGQLNRFPLSMSAGDCQPVACSVFAGEDANKEE